ncbi:hypothetical protein E2C01_026033 [Portunus trituberculatus]|uniref:Uncharacterized protein n=1 Tax=Portunus trituberculatus TaxID=210409 RepID=A0A5B7EHB3_PORTR|nr:hypothetical protein [Portunus trituberculatus]
MGGCGGLRITVLLCVFVTLITEVRRRLATAVVMVVSDRKFWSPTCWSARARASHFRLSHPHLYPLSSFLLLITSLVLSSSHWANTPEFTTGYEERPLFSVSVRQEAQGSFLGITSYPHYIGYSCPGPLLLS